MNGGEGHLQGDVDGGEGHLVVGDVNGGEVHLQGGGAGGAEAFKAGEEALVVDRQLLLFLELGDHDYQEMMIMIMMIMK